MSTYQNFDGEKEKKEEEEEEEKNNNTNVWCNRIVSVQTNRSEWPDNFGGSVGSNLFGWSKFDLNSGS